MIIHSQRTKKSAKVAPKQPEVQPVIQEEPKPVRRERRRKEKAIEEIAIPVIETVEPIPVEEKAKKIFEEIEQEVAEVSIEE